MNTAVLNRPLPPSAAPSVTTDSDSPHSKSVMRQTQAVIGTVILGGVAAAYLVNMAWVVVPAIIGAGLVVAGLTGVCPMALLIARMPWNKGAEAAHQGCCGRR